MKNIEIYLVRHGETEWNRAGRMQGVMDSPLTDKGHEQTRKMGECLARLLDDAKNTSMVSSPLGRTRQTATNICKAIGRDIETCQYDNLLREIDLGDWEGLDFAEIDQRYPGERGERERNKWRYNAHSGESYKSMNDRVQQWFATWFPGDTINAPLIVISHGGTGRILRGLYAGLSEAETLAQDLPQDVAFRLLGGNIERINVND